MISRMCRRDARACSSACCMMSRVTPPILMSICTAVTPSDVPATLKSMSPRWSSSPRMSERTRISLPSRMRPIAMPATGDLIGTPASMSASELPQTVAIDDERLRLAAREERRPVRPRQHLHLARDRADIGEAAAIEAALLADDHAAHDLLVDVLEEVLHFALALRELARERGEHVGAHLP